MPSKRSTELKALDLDGLHNELTNLQAELKAMRFDHAVKGLANPMLLVSTRKEVARIKTEIRSRELESMSDLELSRRSKIRERRR